MAQEAARLVPEVVTSPPSMVTLDEVKRITGLGNKSPIEVLCILEESSDDVGNMTREAFVAAFVEHFLPSLSSAEYERARLLLDRTFDIFDTDVDGIVVSVWRWRACVCVCAGRGRGMSWHTRRR